ncbi:MAG: sulfotransferase domain-containing protein [Calditrichaceae bacterium]|nr:sulfotransferase domain-containing protein [Calditrichaceae bacterium]MBN2710268.1 sulfotransferase domain-containing protein [Calditrichaceae bacterium]RQV93889.1 MAG: sulfotransferase [Calditrichota bacterium]
MQFVFITGMFRSGTTLIEKILTNHNNGYIASQPVPFLYIKLKEIFNKKNNLSSIPYAINPNFPNHFNLNSFTHFLEKRKITRSFIAKIFEDMKNYSGCWTPNIFNIVDKIKENSLSGFYRQICEITDLNDYDKSILFRGSKEIICEDFIEYFLKNNIKVILIIRDPRDIVVSSNFSQKNNYIGQKRPIIYILRMWRKSIAYSLFFKNNPNFLSVQYEHLIKTPMEVLELITNFLQVNSFSNDFITNELKTQDGKIWKGNSSFGRKKLIDSTSIGNYTKALDMQTINYIETICRPEMNYLGYKIKTEFQESCIQQFKEEYKNIHQAFTQFPITQSQIASEELTRISILKSQKHRLNNIEKYFLFNNVYDILKKYMD